MGEVLVVEEKAVETPYPRARSSKKDVGMSVTKVRHMVRVVSRGVQGAPAYDKDAGLFSARDVEAELEGLFAQGWTLAPGFPVFTGMEAYGVIPDAGFRLMYFLIKYE